MERPPKLTPHQRQEALKRREAGESLSDIARTYGVAHTTIARLSGLPASIDVAKVRAMKAEGMGATEIAKALKIGRGIGV